MTAAEHRSWEISRKLCESHADVSKPNKSTGDPVAPRGLGLRVRGLDSGLPSDVRAMGITGGIGCSMLFIFLLIATSGT